MIPNNKRAIVKQDDVQTPTRNQASLSLNLKLNEEIIAEMAADPEIQNEIRLINAEFAETEEDGLSD